MKNLKEGALIFTGLVMTILYLIELGGAEDALMVAVSIVIPLLPVITGIEASIFFGAKNKQYIITMLITIGAGLWFVGDMLWTYVFETAVVSFADVLYLGGYLAIGASVLIGLHSIDPDFFHNKKKIWSWVLGAITVSFIYLKFVPLGWDPEVSVLENILTGGYVVADLILLVVLTPLVMQIFRGVFSQAWLFLGAGILIYAVGDMIYSVYYDVYDSMPLMDLTWFWGNILMAIGLVRYKEGAKKIIQMVRK